MSFSTDEFRALAGAFSGAGYRFGTFTDYEPERTVILRHDIDFSLDYAAELAEVEAELGIRASYFFMLSTHFYNCLSGAGRAAIERIKALGHVVSLHFDPVIHPDLDAGFALERSIFEANFGPIEVVSIHRPGVFLEDSNRDLGGCLHTYQDRLFKELRYVSDSAGAFRHGHPLESDAFRDGRSIHLLLHPIWWVNRPAQPACDRIVEFLRERVGFLSSEAAFHCRAYDGRHPFAIPESGAADAA
ncbi:MAG TPA: hypothetical protein VGB08_03795 [Allosphingosinicella sp.]|jgi:hypothetical protein